MESQGYSDPRNAWCSTDFRVRQVLQGGFGSSINREIDPV